MTPRGVGYQPTVPFEDLAPPSRTPSPSAAQHVERDAVVEGLVDAARRAMVVRDQAVEVAEDTLRYVEHLIGSALGRDPRAVALRGRLSELDGRAAGIDGVAENLPVPEWVGSILGGLR